MSKRAVKAALQRCGSRREAWRRMAIGAVMSGVPSVIDFVSIRMEREEQNITLLNRRLSRTPRKRFRILWWNVVAVFGASALFVWFAIIVLSEWADAAPV